MNLQVGIHPNVLGTESRARPPLSACFLVFCSMPLLGRPYQSRGLNPSSIRHSIVEVADECKMGAQ